MRICDPSGRLRSGGSGGFRLILSEERDLCQACLRAVEQTLDVGSVGKNQQKRYGDAEKDQRMISLEVGMEEVVPGEHRERKGDRRCDRPERDSPGENEHEGKDPYCNEKLYRG